MDTLVEFENIKIELMMNDAPIELTGRGWAHPAKVIGQATRTDLEKMIQKLTLWGCPVLAVESHAVENQTNKPISLLLEKKFWSGKQE